MDLIGSLPAFVVAVLLISASPGPAMALIFRRAVLRGFHRAVPTVLGLEFGLYIWALLAAGGFAALVAASEVSYTILRIVGAAFLVYLGVRSWRAAWRARREADHVADDGAAGGARRTSWGAFAEGAVVQLANPKAAVFMMAFYPQFVPADRPLLATTALLALLQVAIEICFYLTLAACVGRAGNFFRRAKVRRRVEAVSGTVLVGLGARVATIN